MSKKYTPHKQQQSPSHGHVLSSAAVRETIESVVIAFILAFLFRAFEAEAFVIPTGSMAPTLMGLHKDLVCPRCGCPYQLSASREVEPGGAPVAAGTCPMCRYTAALPPPNAKDFSAYDFKEYQKSYSGDRILVGKLIYQFREPERWDVIVFKFPGDEKTNSDTNFIKRLIGLPNETVRIQDGNIWISRDGKEDADFHLERKPPDKLLAMLQPVFDNRYMPRIAALGWPDRWRREGNWKCDDHVAFQTDGEGENWLRYEHRVPSYEQWGDYYRNNGIVSEEVKPRLITDFEAYDTSREMGQHPAPPPNSLGQHWVGDLVLRCTVDVQGESGELIFELRKGGRDFRCRIDVSTGKATLSIGGNDMRRFRPAAATALRGPGRHEVLFGNCDNQMLLWIDGRLVEFDSATDYDENLGNVWPNDGDLQPVGVASVGAAVEIGDLCVLRDIYYIAIEGDADDQSNYDVVYPLDRDGVFFPRDLSKLRRHVEFSLEADQFFALGDNSAFSKDGRLWGQGNHYVPRELLIGKALFIYWPHSWDRIPYVHIPFPFFPNFREMGLVR
ncbi:MAG: hypothetical protein JW959_08020 [Pirellulales bacterium]|nr:hypothetical protein [Pirellulales bacterium]